MRALFSFTGGNGHVLPLLPIARALVVRGHEVLFTCQPAMLDTVRAAGFDAVDSGGTTLTAATHASVTVLAAGGMITPGLVNEPLDSLRAELGVGPGLDDVLTIVPVMPSFRAAPLPAAALSIRPDVLEEREGPDEPAVDAWLAARPGRPLVYFTLGTIFHQESGDLFTRVLAGLERVKANVVVTVGREVDPAELGRRADNVLVERFVPQRALLPRASVVVSHAGSGTVVSALACGVPLVLLPMGADQPWNADRCEVLGVGRVLDPLTVSSADVAAAVEEVLANPAYRSAARALQEEAELLPGAEVAVDVLVDRLRG